MRGAVLVCILAMAAVTACLVNKRSNEFACGIGDECGPGRGCIDGFCVVVPIDAPPDGPDCPFISADRHCSSCDLVAQTCEIDCSNANCNSIACPPGFACNIACTKANGCDAIDCTQAASCVVRCDGNNACGAITCASGGCDITCMSSNACDNITCGPGACDVNCVTTNSCGTVNCGTSCNCDVTCATGACDTITCPMPGGTICTTDGQVGSECSSLPTGCALCPDF